MTEDSTCAVLDDGALNALLEHLTRKGLHQDTPLISLPDKMTDEAWLVLFEMVNANELHGKVQWDETAKTWRAEE